MLKGTCRCGKEIQWDRPVLRQPQDVYVILCPNCNTYTGVQKDEIVPVVKGFLAPKTVLYQVFAIRSDHHVPCNDGCKMDFDEAIINVKAGTEYFPNLTYYMKPVLDGLA